MGETLRYEADSAITIARAFAGDGRAAGYRVIVEQPSGAATYWPAKSRAEAVRVALAKVGVLWDGQDLAEMG